MIKKIVLSNSPGPGLDELVVDVLIFFHVLQVMIEGRDDGFL